MNQLLSQFETEKNEWIFKSIQTFNEGFIRFDGQSYNQDQVLVGIYGPTQVGKTSLILTLLGIGEDRMASLSNALRGGRKKGNSSTITSFIYKHSEDESFHLIFPNKIRIECASLAELEQELSLLREQIESGEAYFDRPIILEIAKSFFTNPVLADISANVSIIDLPGDDTKEIKEQEYVDQILRTYLPLCKVCLVMEISSQIVNLFQMDRPTLKDWMHFPQRFPIVLSRSLGSTAFRTALQQGEITSLESYIEYFRQELNRNDKGDVITNKIFPIELGDSWLEHLTNGGQVIETAKAWVEQLMLELATDLSIADAPENQILQIKNIERSIIKQEQDDITNIEAEINQVKSQLEEDQERLERLSENVTRVREEVEVLDDVLTELEAFTIEEYSYSFAGEFTFDGMDVTREQRKVDHLRSVYQYLSLEINDFFERQAKEIEYEMRSLLLSVNLYNKVGFEHSPSYAMLDLKSVVNSYLFKRNFEKDYEKVEQALEDQQHLVHEYYSNQLTDLKQGLFDDVFQIYRAKKFQFSNMEEKIQGRMDSISQLYGKLSQLYAKLEKVRDEWRQDVERPKLLNKILKEEFVKQVSKWEERLLSPSVSSTEKWVLHQYCQLAIKQAERIIDHDDN